MNETSADIIIIGGGAAGLMAAVAAAQQLTSAGNSGKVIVLEKMPRPGRKIMITGKGRCNFTNVKPWNEFSGHIHPKPNFLKPAFYNLNSENMVDFLQGHGVECVVERGDRAFPTSHLASDVVDGLLKAAGKYGAQVLCGKEVKEIRRNDDGQEHFTVKCSDSSIYTCCKIIICTGGLSYPKTGSTGDGYKWGEEMGHSIRPLFPSLTAIVPKGYKDITISDKGSKVGKGHIDRSTPLSETGNMLCGNQLKNVGLSIIIDGNTAAEEFGDLDFTDGGLEGPIGFKVSRKCVNALMNGSKVQAIIDMKPAVEIEDLQARIAALWNEIAKDKRSANKLYKDRFKILLTKVLPMQLIPGFVKMNPNADHKSLAKALKGWKMDMEGYVGYERCVVTAGGVSQDEITPKTLESRLVPGLYFAGEILDLDGDTGGYNLQIAFSTGYLAGSSAARTLTSK